MRAMIWVAAGAIGALAGGAAGTVVPSLQLSQAARQLSGAFVVSPLAALDPVREAYDSVKASIQTGMTPDQLGFHDASPVVLSMPDPSQWKGVALTLNPALQKNWASVDAQARRFETRMQDMRTYARNPAGWRGAPPF